MLRSIKYVNDNKVVHRDVKLENFLVDIDVETQKVSVKLTDFGLARIVPKGHKCSGKVGTTIAMAPEILKE